jgi:hypothetical protein
MPNDECRMTKEGIPDARTLSSSPVAAAIADYHAHGSEKFQEHLIDHLVNGYVKASPSLFAMFKAVALDDGRIAWYVTYARGDIRTLLAETPFPLPYIAFRSHDRPAPRVWPFDRFLRLAAHLSSDLRFPTSIP